MYQLTKYQIKNAEKGDDDLMMENNPSEAAKQYLTGELEKYRHRLQLIEKAPGQWLRPP
jgi:hypothetical protein